MPEPRERNRAWVARSIREKIIRLELLPAARISEARLAAELGVSRTPVREALMALARVGLIQVFPQRYSFVSYIDYRVIEEAQFARQALELAVLEDFLRRAGPAVYQELHALLDLAEEGFTRAEAMEVLALDQRFHESLFLYSGHELSWQLMAELQVHFDRVRYLHLKLRRDPRVCQEHRALLQALEQGELERAKSLMQGHLAHYRQDRELIVAHYPDYVRP